ncbi:MAG: prolyl oligopeptidase family serine peptidase [Phycisphaeraceae bacterium]|nr:prolyl oligopeptidase family serine peptidase [Phycisphaeraceae bacterium]
MTRFIAILGVLLLAAELRATDPGEALLPIWPARAHEAALGAKGVVSELPGDPSAYRSVMVLLRADPGPAREHARPLLERAGIEDPDAVEIGFEGDNAMFFIPPRHDADAPEGTRTLLFVSLREGTNGIERTWIAYEATGATEVRGLAVIIPGTFGYPPDLYEAWSADLRERGWSVLRLLSQPSRFTERVRVRVGAGTGLEEGVRFAAHADDRTAECAYAVEHAARFVEGLDPRLKDTPRAMLGFSGGAILAPAVVAREPQRYASVVLVAGGAHAARISIDSTFMKQYIRSALFDFTGPEAAADRAEFEDAYLRHATMDAYHAAARLHAGTRVLVIDGSRDRAVPFETSTLLFERLRRAGLAPLRRTYPTNHVMLFMALKDMIADINTWLDGGELALPPGQEATPSP